MTFEFEFSGELIEWRGPAPFYFVATTPEISAEIKDLASVLSYGWGVVPVQGTANGVSFTTSLIPRNGTFLVPIKLAVRKATPIDLGDEVEIWLRLGGATKKLSQTPR